MAKNYDKLYKFFRSKINDCKADKKINLGKFFDGVEEAFRSEGFRETTPQAVENILIVRLDAIGDFILTSSMIREVRKNFPKARITLAVSKLVYPVAELCPYVNEVLIFDGKNFVDNLIEMLERTLNFCRQNLWNKHISLSFNPQWGSDNLGGLFLAYLSGAKVRVGYGNYPYASFFGTPPEKELVVAADNILLTNNVTVPKDLIAEVEHHLYLIPALGFNLNDLSNELWFDAKDFLQAQEFLKEIPRGKRKVAVGIGAGGNSRKYPVQKLAKALQEISKKNIVFVLVGGNSELKDAQFLEKNLPADVILNLTVKTTLRETEAVISLADFYIGNVTGIMHMAATAKVPVLTIYREAEDRLDMANPLKSEFLRFPPWQTKSVILRPEHALDDCANVEVYGGCCHEEAHCIAQVEPQEIIEGFAKLEELVVSG